MTSIVLNFTKANLTAISPPDTGKRTYYKDAQFKWLVLDVRPSGTKSFYIYKKIKGRPERIFLGTFPEMTVESARRNAAIKIGEIADGKNPQEETRKIRNELTFKELFDQYMNRYSKVHKKSWIYDKREVERFLTHWFKRRISDIAKFEVQKLHEKVHAENGLYQANRILERIRGIFNKAIEWGWEGTNPAVGIKKFKEVSRDRFVLPSEMPFLIHALNLEENKTFQDLLWILLLTGARKTNTMMMQWQDISWERQVWRIPETKNGEPVTVPLVGKAFEILKAREETLKSVWVFPQDDDKAKHVVNIKRAWSRTLERATVEQWLANEKNADWVKTAIRKTYRFSGKKQIVAIQALAEKEGVVLAKPLLDIRIHDIRRTFGSYQALTGASLQIIGKSLGHKSQQATQIYSRLNLDPVRASVEKAVEQMLSL